MDATAPCATPAVPGFRRFDLGTLEDLAGRLQDFGLDLPRCGDLGALGRPLTLASGHTLANRFVVQPMEGVDAADDGGPSALTRRRYARYASGGFSLIWAEAVAVVPEGRSGPRQLLINEGNLDAWRTLVAETRAAATAAGWPQPVLIMQLTHSGRWSRPSGRPAPILAHHAPDLDAAVGVADDHPLISDEELDALQRSFLDAALLAERAGFDGVDLKAVHGYLAAELLGAHTRPGRYGGDFDNRTRFFRETLGLLRSCLRRGTIITARLTAFEPSPHPYGWGVAPVAGSVTMDLAEPLRLLALLADGGSPLLNVSLGYPRWQPYMNRPHDVPLVGGPAAPEHPLVGVARFAGVCRTIQTAHPTVPVVSASLSWLRHLLPEVAAGMVAHGWSELVGLGRMAIAYPDAPRDILRDGRLDPARCCTTCSMCSQIMKDAVAASGCVVRDSAIYREEYRRGRSAVRAAAVPSLVVH